MNNLTFVFASIKEYYREHGFLKTVGWIIAKSLKRICRFIYQGMDYKLGVYSFGEKCNPVIPYDPDIHCREMAREDLGRIRENFGDSVAASFSERLNKSTGYIALYGNRVAGYAWSSSGLLRNEGIKPFFVNLLPHAKMIYIYDCYTSPEYRNKKLFSRLLNYLLDDMDNKGFDKAFLTVRKDNSPMLNVISKHGFEIEGEINCRKYLFIISIKNDAFSKVCTVIK